MHSRWDRPTALLLLAFAGYTITTSWRMGYWQGRIPGPGFAPIWIGAGLALAAILLLLRPAPARALTPATPAPAAMARETTLVLQIGAATAAATMLIPQLGLLVAVAFLLIVLVKLLGGSWRAAAGTAVLLPAVFYMVFVQWLQVPVPRGPWGF